MSQPLSLSGLKLLCLLAWIHCWVRNQFISELTYVLLGIILASQKLLDFLNKGIARELQVSIQYMWQHIQVTGTDGAIVEDVFRKTAIAEMKHAERLAERFDYLNGSSTQPNLTQSSYAAASSKCSNKTSKTKKKP